MTILKEEIYVDPLGLGYAVFLPDSPGSIADLLNAQAFVQYRTMMVREIEIIGLYTDGPVAGDDVLAKLEAFATTAHPLARIVSRALKALGQPEGLDLGSDAVQSMLTLLSQAGAITLDEAEKLKAIANQPASRAEILGIGQVSIQQVIEAM